jgi:hypothetical protein
VRFARRELCPLFAIGAPPQLANRLKVTVGRTLAGEKPAIVVLQRGGPIANPRITEHDQPSFR